MRNGSKYAEELRKVFPIWSKIRKDPNSIGAQFLSVIGWRLEEAEWYLNYLYEQLYIDTADIKQLDHVYKFQLPNGFDVGREFQFTENGKVFSVEMDIRKFLRSRSPYDHTGPLYARTVMFLDVQDKTGYVYDKQATTSEEGYGYIHCVYVDVNGVKKEEDLPLQPHHVWNALDEFGLLLQLPRLPLEDNESYKKRLIDVFKRKPGSHEEGLRNGMARELGLVYMVDWEEGEKYKTLYHDLIDEKSIYIDDQPYMYEILYDEDGRVILTRHDEDVNKKQTIRYIAGVNAFVLHDPPEKIRKKLYTPDGTVSGKMTNYIRLIKEQTPIHWGEVKWGQGLWLDEAKEGFGSIPALLDAKFASWEKLNKKVR